VLRWCSGVIEGAEREQPTERTYNDWREFLVVKKKNKIKNK